MTYDHYKTSNPDDETLGPRPYLCERCGVFCEPEEDASEKDCLCENCRAAAYEREQERRMEDGGRWPRMIEQQRAAYKIKRGWRSS